MKMAPIEVPEVEMFDKTIRLVKEQNVRSDAVVGYAKDSGKFINNRHEGSNGIILAMTGGMFLLILVIVMIAVCTSCYRGGKKIAKWWKKKRDNKVSTAINDNGVIIEMTNIPQDSTYTTKSTPPPFERNDSSPDDSFHSVSTI